MLPSVFPRLSTDSAVRVFPGVWKLLSFLRLPSQDRAPFLPLLSLFLSFIFFPTSFQRQWALFWCLMSSASIQKLFCEIFSVFKCSFDKFVREKVASPSYSSTILGPPPQFFLMIKTNYNKIRGQHLFTLQREITRKVIISLSINKPCSRIQ